MPWRLMKIVSYFYGVFCIWGPKQAGWCGLISRYLTATKARWWLFLDPLLGSNSNECLSLCVGMCVFHAGATRQHFPFLDDVSSFSPPCGGSLCTLSSDLQLLLLHVISRA